MTPDDLAAIEAHAAALPPHRTRGYLLELARAHRELQAQAEAAAAAADHWEGEAWRVRGEREAAEEALRELVALKDVVKAGDPAEYERRKGSAWDAARAVLKKPPP
jgi:hypothetical protein